MYLNVSIFIFLEFFWNFLDLKCDFFSKNGFSRYISPVLDTNVAVRYRGLSVDRVFCAIFQPELRTSRIFVVILSTVVSVTLPMRAMSLDFPGSPLSS